MQLGRSTLLRGGREKETARGGGGGGGVCKPKQSQGSLKAEN